MCCCKRKELYGTGLFGFEIRLGHKQTQQTPKKLERRMRICLMGAAGFLHVIQKQGGRPIWVLLRLLGLNIWLIRDESEGHMEII